MFLKLWNNNKKFVIVSLILLVVVLAFIIKSFSSSKEENDDKKKDNSKSNFNDLLINNNLTEIPPKNFSNLDGENVDNLPLLPPTVKEEIGLGIAYPQGAGVGMSDTDSNSFTIYNPGPLLTDYTIPESYGESSLTDPSGEKGASQGARILKLNGTGNQLNYKPLDESEKELFSAAYKSGEVQTGKKLINGSNFINYSDNFNPESQLSIQTSPGQNTTLNNCEQTYPNVEKYEDFCITDGDIPYGQIVNGKVNPRLVSRWESYTGDYSRAQALESIDGVLYPKLNMLN